jgi:hypothetical protein
VDLLLVWAFVDDLGDYILKKMQLTAVSVLFLWYPHLLNLNLDLAHV